MSDEDNADDGDNDNRADLERSFLRLNIRGVTAPDAITLYALAFPVLAFSLGAFIGRAIRGPEH